MKMTKNQIEIMKHTISDKDRNWFGCDDSSTDGKDFEKLVENGYAAKQKAASWMRENTIYSLTQLGKDFIREYTK